MESIQNKVLEELKKIVGETYLWVEPSAMAAFAQDESIALPVLPQAVVFPADTLQISEILKICNLHRIPVTVRGGGSGLTGAAVPEQGGIVLDIRRLNQILSIDFANFQVTVEPGVVTEILQNTLKEKGLYYPPDPSSRGSSFIGGNVATNAGGPRAVKYGVVREYVLNLEVVLADGAVIWTGANTLKNSTGYSLTQLMIGSEGTLGVVTKIVLKLLPHPTHDMLLLAPFRSVRGACEAVSAIFRAGITPSAIELMDRKAIDWAADYLAMSRLDIGEDIAAQLLIEVDGFDSQQLQEDCEKIYAAIADFDAGEILFADNEVQKRELWKLRRNVSSAIKAHKIYKKEDTVVPRQQMPQLLEAVAQLEEKYGFDAVCFGHAGDGNLHINIVQGQRLDAEVEHWSEAIVELVTTVKNLGGTLSGEHGIGSVQKPYMSLMVGDTNLQLMRGIKQVFDPNNILNPGKIF